MTQTGDNVSSFLWKVYRYYTTILLIRNEFQFGALETNKNFSFLWALIFLILLGIHKNIFSSGNA